MSDTLESERTAGYWLGYHDGEKSGRSEAAAEIERLRAALKDARVSVEGWADYASDYIKEKWDLKGDLARIDAALEGKR